MFASTNTYLAYFILDCWMEVNAVGNEVSTILSYRVVIVLFIDVQENTMKLLFREKADLDRAVSLFNAEWNSTELLKENIQRELLKKLDNDVSIILCCKRVRLVKSTAI